MSRLESNKKILDILTAYIHQNPDIRFCQALCNLGLPNITIVKQDEDGITYEDKYYEEPDRTLETVKARYAGMQPPVEYKWNPRSKRHEKVQV